MENRKIYSYVNYRDPSTDRICRPRNEKPILCDLTETDEENENNLIESDQEIIVDDSNSDSDSDSSLPCSLSSIKTASTSNSVVTTTTTTFSSINNSSDKVIGNSITFEEALVYIRLRPVISSNNNKLYEISENNLIVSDKLNENRQKQFKFTDIFNEKIEQNIIYDRCVYQKIESEENLTIITYGTSGSGKTFTLLGDNENPGIIPRAFEHLFKYYENNIYPSPTVKIENAKLYFLDDNDIEKHEHQRNMIFSNINEIQKSYESIQESINNHHNFQSKICTEPMSVLIWISFIEIYNENVNDLLFEQITSINNIKSKNKNIGKIKRKDYQIITNNGKAYIKDLTSIYVKNSLEAYSVLINGLKHVSYGTTQINDHSSRSHFIVFLDIITFTEPQTFSEISYKFCDLAGSERISKIGDNTSIINCNKRIKETQKINKSLSVLGRCLEIAYQNQNKKHNDMIPYRESKLTMLLHHALCGKERLTMIVNLIPIDDYYDENLNVLHFSSIAKNIIYKTPKKDKNKSRYSWLSQQKQQQFQQQQQQKLLKNQINNDYSEAYEKLYEENLSLQSKVDELQIQLEESQKTLQKELLTQEIDIRQLLCSKFKQELEENDELWKKTLEQKEKNLEKSYELKLERQERSYKSQIQELQDEINDLEELLENKERHIQEIEKSSNDQIQKLQERIIELEKMIENKEKEESILISEDFFLQ